MPAENWIQILYLLTKRSNKCMVWVWWLVVSNCATYVIHFTTQIQWPQSWHHDNSLVTALQMYIGWFAPVHLDTLPVNSPHKGQWRGAFMFSLICAWISGWTNSSDAGDLRSHRAYYDVIVMPWSIHYKRNASFMVAYLGVKLIAALWRLMATQTLVNIVSDNGRGQFHRKCSTGRYHSLQGVCKLLIWKCCHMSQGQMSKMWYSNQVT